MILEPHTHTYLMEEYDKNRIRYISNTDVTLLGEVVQHNSRVPGMPPQENMIKPDFLDLCMNQTYNEGPE